MPVQKLLAKIHIAKKELALDEETYREVLSSEFGVRSSKDLDNRGAIKLINYFRNKGWAPKIKAKKYDDLGKRDPYKASPGQLRKIEVMWHEIYRGNSELKHLRQFLFNEVKVSDPLFLDKDQAHKIIEALKAMQTRRGHRA